jgi:hypothetical protein
VKNRKEKSLLSLVCVGNNLLFFGCGPAAGLARVRFRHSGLDAGVNGVCAVGIVAAGFGAEEIFSVLGFGFVQAEFVGGSEDGGGCARMAAWQQKECRD